MKKNIRNSKKKKFKFKPIPLAVLLLAIIFFVFSHNLTKDFMGGDKNSDSNITLSIESGIVAKDIASLLKDKEIIKYPRFFRIISKLSGYDGKYQEGIFYINDNMSYLDILTKLTGPPDSIGEIKVTIPEGYELRQIADILEKNGLVKSKEFCSVAEKHDFDYDFLKDIPKRENRLEGYLFPDTYIFTPKNSAEEIIDIMLTRFDEKFTTEYKKRAEELDMTVDEIVTLASVIEREAKGDADRDNVSSVFHNRLKSEDYPYLQSCATVQYILKERKEILSSEDTQIDSPYNTYKNPGLPIGPIASPGEKSIKAALYPAETDYLFFVLDSTETHRFSKTYEEHLENSKK